VIEKNIWVPNFEMDGGGVVVHDLAVGVQSSGPYLKILNFHELVHLHRIRSRCCTLPSLVHTTCMKPKGVWK
jgi:hypothetical protein